MKTHIFVDSSTKRTSKSDKRGESVSAWAVWREGDMDKKPIMCGINYSQFDGPNKAFYDGVIRALERCLPICWNDEVIVWGDCELAINQLNGRWKVKWTNMEYKQTRALERKFIEKNNSISFKYIGEKHPIYKKIDQLAKRSRAHILNIIK